MKAAFVAKKRTIRTFIGAVAMKAAFIAPVRADRFGA